MKKNIAVNSFYCGSSVFLLTTVDTKTGTVNIAPLSSSLSLGNKIIVGVNKGSKTHENLLSGSDAVLNFPDSTLWPSVEKLGRMTGKNELTENQIQCGFITCNDKFSKMHFHTELAAHVTPPRIRECSIQAECRTVDIADKGKFALIEFDIVETWFDEYLLNKDNKLDTSKWKPLVYKFREYGTTGAALGVNYKYGQ